MAENKIKKFPHFASTGDLVEYFDTHDLGDHLEGLPEVEFEVDIQHRKHLFILDEDLADQLEVIASHQHIASELLINTWVREKALGVTDMTFLFV